MNVRIGLLAAAGMASALALPARGQWQYQGSGIYYNGGFVGVGTTAPTTSAELFGLLGNTSGYAGMYARTTGASGQPFYGYRAGGNPAAWHYLDGATGTWHLFNGGGNRLSVTSGGSVGIGITPNLFRLDVAGTARLRADGGFGDVLMIGGHIVPVGLTTEDGWPCGILNLDLNFRGIGKSNARTGAAVRLDSRPEFPPIQFLTRPAGSATETTAMGITSEGRVGIGTSTPGFPLHVVAPPGTDRGVTGEGLTQGVVGMNSVASQTQPTEYVGQGGVIGIALAETGDTAGVWGASLSREGTGVVGAAKNGGGFGVRGLTYGSSGVGVYGEANNYIFESQSGNPVGVFGYAKNIYGGTTIGVKGRVLSSTYGSAYGIYSEGPIGSSATKSFRIDHPDDPKKKYLLHYCSEAPEPQNFYNGIVRLDARGWASVTLPVYFSKINRDPRYSLTPIGAPMPMLHVAARIDAKADRSEFVIAGGVPNGEVSWEVKAIRNDAWVRTYGAPVEVEKQGPERGTYQHPELYGQPAEPLRPIPRARNAPPPTAVPKAAAR
jgi:trimeric autotransporter adhesin